MRYVCLFVLSLPLLSAQDGAVIYKERCASCHDMPAERVPSRAAIQAMSGEALYLTLTTGVMKSRAEGLTTPQIFALLAWVNGAACRETPSWPSRSTPRSSLPAESD